MGTDQSGSPETPDESLPTDSEPGEGSMGSTKPQKPAPKGLEGDPGDEDEEPRSRPVPSIAGEGEV